MKIQSLASFSLCLTLCVGASAQERLVPKQLNGPVDEVRHGVMAQVHPAAVGMRSKSAMIPVELQPTKNGTWQWQNKIAVDGENFTMMLFSGNESWNVRLGQPFAKSMVSAKAIAAGVERSSLALDGSSFEGEQYSFEKVRTGEWTISVEADAPVARRGYLLYSSDSPYRQLSYKASRDQLVGDEISFVAYGFENIAQGPGFEANAGLVQTASLRITDPNGVEISRPMFDDGRNGDALAGDGIFGGSFSADAAGVYQAQVITRGLTPEGLPFVRTAEHLVPVIAQPLTLVHEYASALIVDDRRLQVSLAVDALEDAGSHYRVFAEVWGADADGKMVPVSWIGGMSYLENDRLDLGLDMRWIGLAGAQSRFELRNLRIEDPDHFIPAVRVASLPLLTPKLPMTAYAAPKSMDEEMFVGPRPATSAAKAGGRLLLVHGYCSGDAWGPVSGQFSNDSVFADFNKNRSHDAFAQRIASFGSSWNSYGIVAHSQGGAAALHLYTYYWSGLDNATGGRLIQSVGTPYQGTSLAGNIAALGSIFGAGCGSNTDLTYSGASSWLSGIPSWARGAVNYYTTSYTDKWWRYDYCHFASDLILSDPEDGTTEKAYGQLSGAVNRGHKTGWCHTGGMRDPSQVTDSSRNSTMNSSAAN